MYNLAKDVVHNVLAHILRYSTLYRGKITKKVLKMSVLASFFYKKVRNFIEREIVGGESLITGY